MNFIIYLNRGVLLSLLLGLISCDLTPINNPYLNIDPKANILYSAFDEQPKHLDPAKAYSSDEYGFISQIYEPPLQYSYLKRPYQLEPLTATRLPIVEYLDSNQQKLLPPIQSNAIAYTDYIIEIKPQIYYQPHPAFVKKSTGEFVYHHLTETELADIAYLTDFKQNDTRELIAADYVYQIKRLADPTTESPIAEIMKQYIVGFAEFAQQRERNPQLILSQQPLSGVTELGRYRYKIRIKGKYPQFKYWLAMPFFAPMPIEADLFYAQPKLKAKNITLDWFPIGTGAYYLTENNPNRRMVLTRNPYFHREYYPIKGEKADRKLNLFKDSGKILPFIDQAIYSLEKETIPYWNKFLQGYYDGSGIGSDNFEQAIQFSDHGEAEVSPQLAQQGIHLTTTVSPSIMFLGFNMLDPIVGGYTESARKLRLAISIAIDYEEHIAIFLNGRAITAQGAIPPGIFGFATQKQDRFNPYVYQNNGQRLSIQKAKQLLIEAGYAGGIDPKTKEALILYFDTTATNADDRPIMNWYRKQFEKLGIKLVIRGSDYNRFQEKIRTGNMQLFINGWNADYPDPENFLFLFYSGNAKVKFGGENMTNYVNPEFDRLFEQMRVEDNNIYRYQLIQQMQQILRHDAPWVFGLHPKKFILAHDWYQNLKPNAMANNQLKYLRINAEKRQQLQQQWNRPIILPLLIIGLIILVALLPAVIHYRRKFHQKFTAK